MHVLTTETYILKCCHTQPVDLNLDEETLMSIASFWRTSLSDSNTQSRQFYFDHFEILPIKV